jgi:D-alanyl-D-alanine carboxypeptidase (penicillin-binding protein 5/6)
VKHRARLFAPASVAAALVVLAAAVGSAAPAHPTPPPTPVHGTPSPFQTELQTPKPTLKPPKIRATGAILEDLDTGQVLFELKPNTRRPIASVTKIMTALVVLENLSVEDPVTVSGNAASQTGSILGLQRGERISVRNLLYALLLQSSNDAAVSLAEAAAGSVDRFLTSMNDRAHAIGLRHSRFYSPNGLDDRGYSTPADLARLTRSAELLPLFAKIVRTRTHRITSLTGPPRTVQNRNVLLWLYKGAVGVKTGFTTPAGNCLVAVAERSGRRLVAVVLGAPEEAFDGGATLLDYGFDSFVETTLVREGQDLGTIPVQGLTLQVAGGRTVERLLRRDQVGQVTRTVVPMPRLELPLTIGQRVGRVMVFANGEKVGESVAVAAADLALPQTPPGPPAAPPGGQPIDDVAEILGLLVRTMFGSFL